MLDRHRFAGPQFKCSGALEKHHAKAVHCLAANFLCHGTHSSFKRGVGHVNNDKLRAEVRLVRNNGLTFQRFHSNACCIYENIAVRHFFFQLVKICQIIENSMA